MLVKIQQHQTAWKQPAKNVVPAMGRGEQFCLVEQHKFVGLRPKQHNAGLAEHIGAVDEAELRRIPLDMPLGVGEHRKRLAYDRPALIARNMLERTPFQRTEAY